MEHPPELTMYGTAWCGDCRRARSFLDRNEIPYKWVDIDVNEEGRRYVESVNNGMRRVPTLLFPDGSILVEPSEWEMEATLAS